MRGITGVVLVLLGVAAGLGYIWHEGRNQEPTRHGGGDGGWAVGVDEPRADGVGASGASGSDARDTSAPVARAPSRDGRTVGAGGTAGDRGGRGGRATVAGIGVRPAERHAAPRAPDPRWGASAEPLAAGAAPAPRVVEAPARRAAPGGVGADVGALVAEAREPDGGGDDVLLSLPLHGDVEPEQGTGVPPQTSGLVTNGGAVEFTEDAQFTLPAGGHVSSDAGTISFAIEPRWAGADESNNSLLQIRDEHAWENSIGIVKNYNSLRYVIHDERGIETNVNVYIDAWQPNQRHVVTATWDEERMTLAVDGEQVGEAPLPNRLRLGETTPIHVGSDFPGSTYRGANGRISDLTISATAPGAAGTP